MSNLIRCTVPQGSSTTAHAAALTADDLRNRAGERLAAIRISDTGGTVRFFAKEEADANARLAAHPALAAAVQRQDNRGDFDAGKPRGLSDGLLTAAARHRRRQRRSYGFGTVLGA